MALQVWLPLNGNLDNQGVSNVTVTNNGATVSDNGKIGKGYEFKTTQYLEINNLPFSQLTNCSISFWIKVTGMGSNGWLPFGGQTTSYYILATQNNTSNFYHYNIGSNVKSIYIDGVLGTKPGSLNEWHHYCITGVNLSTWTKFYINKYSSAFCFAGCLNDVRIYDHCLSLKEVSDIAKGLVLHYKLEHNKLKICEYLEKSSAAGTKDYIDTGVSGYTINSIRCVCKASINTTADSAFFGSRGSYYLFYNLSGNYFWPQSKAETINGTLTINTKYIIDYNKGHLTVVDENGYLYQEASRSGTTVQNLNLYIFNFNPVDNRTAQAKIYYFKIYNNDELIRDFVPCTYNGEAGFLERLSGIFYGNKGPGTFTAGPELTLDPDIKMYDCSGYNRNGTINGTLSLSTDSPRYDNCTEFDSNTYIQTESPSTEVRSVSLWVKWNSIPSYQSVVFVDQKSKIGFGLTSTGILCSSAGVTTTYYQKSLLSANTWYHFVIVNTGTEPTSTTRDLYINGVKQTLYTGSSNWVYSLDYLQLGKRSTTSDGFNGQIADFRMYATALSEQDIQELYNTSAYVDNKQNMECFEIREDAITEAQITKRGQIECNTLTEETESSIDGDGNIECNQIIEI